MINSNQLSIQNHPHQGYIRMKDLATTAERKPRQFTDKNGVTRKIKGRPPRQGILPLGESTIYEMIRRGEFPKGITLSERVIAWNMSDITEWLQSKQIQSNQ